MPEDLPAFGLCCYRSVIDVTRNDWSDEVKSIWFADALGAGRVFQGLKR